MDDFEEMNKTTEVEDVEVDKTEANTEEYMDENEEKLRVCKVDGDPYVVRGKSRAKVPGCPPVRRLPASGHVL